MTTGGSWGRVGARGASARSGAGSEDVSGSGIATERVPALKPEAGVPETSALFTLRGVRFAQQKKDLKNKTIIRKKRKLLDVYVVYIMYDLTT